MLKYIESGRPTPLGELRPSVPRALSDLLMRCIEKEPERRYPSAESVLQDLGNV